MRISVIIPSYKPGTYIQKCLDSLEIEKDNSLYEIIIILNGCNEPYKSCIHKYCQEKSYKNIRIIQTDTPGVSNARNIGINNASGDYIIFIDDDDWVSPYYLDNMYALGEPYSIVHSNTKQVEDKSQREIPHFITEAFKKCTKIKHKNLFNSRSLLSSCWAMLIPTSIIGKQRFDVKHKLGEDSLFMFSISHKIKKITLTSENDIYYIRAREKSASRKHYAYTQRVKVALRLLESYFRQYLQYPFSYNLSFFTSRIIATVIKLRKRQYE